VDLLGLKAALIPLSPGNLSAFGLLTVDVRYDYVQTLVQRDDALDVSRLERAYAELEARAEDALALEGFSSAQTRILRSADLRYFGQAWEVSVEVPTGHLDRASADVTVRDFHTAHARAYGYSYAGQPEQRIEWVNLRVTGIGPLRRPSIQPMRRTWSEPVERARTAEREVWFESGCLQTPIFARERLQPDDCLDGPAVVEEFGSTTLVFPQQRMRVDAFGNLVIEKRA
jgi:N-methylhydantoinase A